MTDLGPADASATRPFRTSVPDDVIDDIRTRARAFRWHAWTEPPDAGGWRYGPPVSFMRALCSHWADGYDWRRHERTMNAQPHFATRIDDLDLHFIREKGSGSDPSPLLIAHGWPYSWHSCHEMIGPLARPERHGGRIEDAFDAVIPVLSRPRRLGPAQASEGPPRGRPLVRRLDGEARI